MNYEELCVLVGKICKEAEIYMRGDAKKARNFNDVFDESYSSSGYLCLMNSIDFIKSPQGSEFWENIIDEMILRDMEDIKNEFPELYSLVKKTELVKVLS